MYKQFDINEYVQNTIFEEIAKNRVNQRKLLMPAKLKQFIIPLRISSVIYALIGIIVAAVVLFVPSESNSERIVMIVFGGTMFLVSFGIIVFNEIVIAHLKKGKFWAWIAGICISGLYIPSIFLLLGIFMLRALIDNETKAFCAKK